MKVLGTNMKAGISFEDAAFRARFDAGKVTLTEFHHREHLRLAYAYLCSASTEAAYHTMKISLKRFLSKNGVPASKYHETLTRSWLEAVKHFMVKAGSPKSFDEFIEADDRLLSVDILLTHYKRDTLFSDKARIEFVRPDIAPIPQYS